jgi:hypothetical protein
MELKTHILTLGPAGRSGSSREPSLPVSWCITAGFVVGMRYEFLGFIRASARVLSHLWLCSANPPSARSLSSMALGTEHSHSLDRPHSTIAASFFSSKCGPLSSRAGSWSECVKPVAKTESCQVPHLVYVVSGRIPIPEGAPAPQGSQAGRGEVGAAVARLKGLEVLVINGQPHRRGRC